MNRIGVFVLFMWILCVCSSSHGPRVKTDQGITHYTIKHSHSGLRKLIRSTSRGTIWVGDDENLFPVTSTQDKQVNVALFKDECKEIEKCEYTFSLLGDGVDGNLLFMCGTTGEKTKCYNMNVNYALVDGFEFTYGLNMNDPSLLIGDMLYLKSTMGLYRINRKTGGKIWPYSPVGEQKYVKLVTGNGQDKDKLYSFFTEKRKSDNGGSESDLWIPRVSQICMNDKGGSKDVLQFSWTSMIYTRLSCGAVELSFTQLIDVATVDNDTKIYALFRNIWNMSAVCVYNMTEISRIFSSSEFIEIKNMKFPVNHRPGQCVDDSTRLSPDILRFMRERPEVKDSVMPETKPLLFKHHHYTHIQVQRLEKSSVLFLALESGGIHKVLESSTNDPLFIIAEFRPFQHRTHISSMLLDESEKRLYVSFGEEVIHIDLQRCDLYGDQCEQCLLSRDPYCGWSGSHCTHVSGSLIQDIKFCNSTKVDYSRTEVVASAPVLIKLIVTPSSRYYLTCPIISNHASYHWYHGNTHEECVQADRDCLYLIESMNKTHEGLYRCVSSEKNYHINISSYELIMSSSPALMVNTIVLPCLLLLLFTHLLL
ncbi:semaphorin-7A-like [Paramisgurnus dabryanus]|uniref:semaphorin-7A-like n=1 Tax=Paramisgurnus dabryanus TaxID=90735 RepID=UPI0031F423E6